MSVKDTILDMLYPLGCVCALCGREAHTKQELCTVCARELRLCTRVAPPAGIDGFRAGLLYTPPVREALHRFIYGRQTYLADFFAMHMELPTDWEIGVILPVPLHPKRYRWRGFNQSELLADCLGLRYALSVRTDVLSRCRETRTQTELTVAQRAENVKGAFAAENCAGLRVLLIDDVCTTGSTLCACAEALRRAGAASVYAMTAVYPDGENDTIDR